MSAGNEESGYPVISPPRTLETWLTLPSPPKKKRRKSNEEPPRQKSRSRSIHESSSVSSSSIRAPTKHSVTLSRVYTNLSHHTYNHEQTSRSPTQRTSSSPITSPHSSSTSTSTSTSASTTPSLHDLSSTSSSNEHRVALYHRKIFLPRLNKFLKEGRHHHMTRVLGWERIRKRLEEVGCDVKTRNRWLLDFKHGHEMWDGVRN